jgi:type IV pilus assembly protein PilN
MAVHINLLPYRKIRRAARQKLFNGMLLAALVAGVGVALLGQLYINNRIDSQKERNAKLEAAIVQLDKELEEIKNLKSRISDVLERKRVIENLQSGRSRAVVLLDEITRKLPEGMYLNSIRQQGDLITLDGVADTNARVAELVHNLEGSQSLESPDLIDIHTVTVKNLRQSAFTLSVKQKAQKPAEAEQK